MMVFEQKRALTCNPWELSAFLRQLGVFVGGWCKMTEFHGEAAAAAPVETGENGVNGEYYTARQSFPNAMLAAGPGCSDASADSATATARRAPGPVSSQVKDLHSRILIASAAALVLVF